MSNHLRHRLSGLILICVLAFATMATGFAHHAPFSRDDALRLSHAQFWGETVADLCGKPGGGGQAAAGADCAACNLVAAAVLPEAVQAPVALDLRLARNRVVPPAPVLVHLVQGIAPPVRAPPVV